MNIFTGTFDSTLAQPCLVIESNMRVSQFSFLVKDSSDASLTGNQGIYPYAPNAIGFAAGQGMTYTAGKTPLNGISLTVNSGSVDVTMVLEEE